jgi:hypothetical protein
MVGLPTPDSPPSLIKHFCPSQISENSELTINRTLGVKTADVDIQKKVTLDYTMAAAETFSRLPSRPISEKTTPRSPFRFVFASGILAVRDQSKSVWFASGARHIKGDAENKLLGFTAENREVFDAYIVRPGAVLANGGGVAGVAVSLGAPAVSVQGLAAVMVELALSGGEEKVLENSELVARGKGLVKGVVEN